jgi:hypothetical protein
VLSNEPVVVKCGHYIVEVKPQVYTIWIYYYIFSLSTHYVQLTLNEIHYLCRELARVLLWTR